MTWEGCLAEWGKQKHPWRGVQSHNRHWNRRKSQTENLISCCGYGKTGASQITSEQSTTAKTELRWTSAPSMDIGSETNTSVPASISHIPKTAPGRVCEEPALPGWFISLVMSSGGRTRVLCLQLLVICSVMACMWHTKLRRTYTRTPHLLWGGRVSGGGLNNGLVLRLQKAFQIRWTNGFAESSF